MNVNFNKRSTQVATIVLILLLFVCGVTILLGILFRSRNASPPAATDTLASTSTFAPVFTETQTARPTFVPTSTPFPTFTIVVLPPGTIKKPTRTFTAAPVFTRTKLPGGPTSTPTLTKTPTLTSNASSSNTPGASTATLTNTPGGPASTDSITPGGPTLTPSITSSPTLTSDAPTATSTASHTPTPTNTNSPPVGPAVFAVGPGGADVIPHQIVRASSNFLYLFSSQDSSSLLRVYRTNNPGFPNSASDFAAPITINESSSMLSVDAVYNGGTIIHVLINLRNGEIKDYPFDTSTNTFKTAITLATDSGSVSGSPYVGTSGISGMMEPGGTLHVGYWTNSNHIPHRAYTYNSGSNTLTPAGGFTQVDTAGSANHPSLAISPANNSLTVAWISQAVSPPQILTRARQSNGTWGSIETASTSPVWTSSSNGLNIDQGPSLIIDSSGAKHMAYIQEFDLSVGDYGRIHYVSNNGSGWVDQPLAAFTHDPAVAINSSGQIYIIGHGHPLNATCTSMDDICTIRKNGANWNNPVLFASPPGSFSFDASPSVKWSVVGFNRADIIEFVFFMTPYESPTLYYGRFP